MSYLETYTKVVHYSEANEERGFDESFHNQTNGEKLNTLVYADWLQDQGKETLANILRYDANIHSNFSTPVGNTPYITSIGGSLAQATPKGKWVVVRDTDIHANKPALSLVRHSLHDPNSLLWWVGGYDSKEEREAALQKAIEEGAIHVPEEDSE